MWRRALCCGVVGSTGAFLSHSESDEYKLKHVQVVFRHGARTPVFDLKARAGIEWNTCSKVTLPPGANGGFPDLPNVYVMPLHITSLDKRTKRPYSGVDERQLSVFLAGKTCRRGQLTDLGAIQAAELGESLKQRYEPHLDMKSVKIHARTTNVARCIATLSIALGSFVPPSRRHVVLPVTTTETRKEFLMPNVKQCPMLREYMRRGKGEWVVTKDPRVLRINEIIKQKVTLPSEFKELKLEENHYIRVNDWVTVMEAHGMPNPWGFTEDEQIEIRKLASEQLMTFWRYGTSEEKKCNKVTLGKFIEEIVDNIQSSSANSIYFYSAHDTTVLPLLGILGIYDNDWPKYCANIAVETWQCAGLPEQVRVLYNGEEKLRMGAKEFMLLLETSTPDSTWEEQCAIEDDQFIVSGAKGDAGL